MTTTNDVYRQRWDALYQTVGGMRDAFGVVALTMASIEKEFPDPDAPPQRNPDGAEAMARLEEAKQAERPGTDPAITATRPLPTVPIAESFDDVERAARGVSS